MCEEQLFDLPFSQIQLEYATPLSRIFRGKKLANRTLKRSDLVIDSRVHQLDMIPHDITMFRTLKKLSFTIC